MNNQDNYILSELYSNNPIFLEAADQEAEIKQKLEAEYEKNSATILSDATALYKKYSSEIATAKEAGPDAIEQLMKKIEAEMKSQSSNESLELQEGIFDRARSRLSGLGSSIKGPKPGATGVKGDYYSGAVNKRFSLLQNTIGKDLRELERDLETTSNVDNTVKDQIKNMITTMSVDHNIAPVTSKFGDFRNKVGQVVQGIGTGAVLAFPVMALAAPLAATLGLGAAGTAAVAAGLGGATTSALRDLINGSKPNIKKAVATGAAAALTAGLLTHLTTPVTPKPGTMGDMSHAKIPGLENPTLPAIPKTDWNALLAAGKSVGLPADSTASIIKDWPTYTHTPFNALKGGLDQKALASIAKELKDKGLEWATAPGIQKREILNRITDALLKKK